MLYRYLLSKKGFTLVEMLIVVAVMSILVAIAVPVFNVSVKKQRQNECANQRTVISTAVKQVMFGMVDNGKKQDKISFQTTTMVKNQDNSETFTVIPCTTKTVEDGKVCFKLTGDNTCFTIGDIRGGYRDSSKYEYNEGCAHGQYLKKLALKDVEFYKYLQNEELPICPFADYEDEDTTNNYYYYVLEDGSVLCSCPECNEAD